MAKRIGKFAGISKRESALSLVDGGSIAGTLSSTGAATFSSTVAATGLITATAGVSGASTASGGAGSLSTEIAVARYLMNANEEIISTIKVDLTGLAGNNDEGDVIGLAAGGVAWIDRVVTSTHGLIHKIEVTCIELPTSGANNLLDIDLRSNSASAAATTDGSSYTALIDAGGSWAVGTTKQQLVTMPAANDYIYLIEGAASGGANTFTQGKFIVKLYGHASF